VSEGQNDAGGDVAAGEPLVPDEIIDNAETGEIPPQGSESAADSTVGTGSIIGIGCSVFALLFILIAVCIFMYRQVT
jgi:hypothetical protein